VSGVFNSPNLASDSGTGNQFTANNVVWVRQFTLDRPYVVGHLSVQVTANVAASTLDAGIYNASGALLANLGGLAGTSTGNLVVSITQQTLPAGAYYLAWTASATSGVAGLSLREATLDSDLTTGAGTLLININGTGFSTAANAATSGVLPASLGTITKNNSPITYLPVMFCEPRATCLVAEVMRHEPYKSAKRVFWIMDNCSAHRGQKAV
jgi:hypothetical protein